MQNVSYKIKKRESKVVIPKNPGFGQHFTDHVFEMDYNEKEGWHNCSIKPLDTLSFHPATMFIHYGQSAFEGMKAFRTVSNEIVLFRPDRHFNRLNASSRRLCMPEIDVNFAVEVLKELVAIDKDWVPYSEEESLYIRPFIFGIDPVLGVKPSATYKFIILLSPVGAYYPEGFKPVKILVQDEYVRAIRKGLGECKTPANYAASLLATEAAKKLGYTQVLWLDAVELKYIEEVGTMNIFVTLKDEVVTPKLTGGILRGITRASVLELLKEWGINYSERLISIDEAFEAHEKNALKGIFGTGTAAVISSVGVLKYKDKEIRINDMQPGELDVRLFNEITSIQRGKIPDRHGWLVPVEAEVTV